MLFRGSDWRLLASLHLLRHTSLGTLLKLLVALASEPIKNVFYVLINPLPDVHLASHVSKEHGKTYDGVLFKHESKDREDKEGLLAGTG